MSVRVNIGESISVSVSVCVSVSVFLVGNGGNERWQYGAMRLRGMRRSKHSSSKWNDFNDETARI